MKALGQLFVEIYKSSPFRKEEEAAASRLAAFVLAADVVGQFVAAGKAIDLVLGGCHVEAPDKRLSNS